MRAAAGALRSWPPIFDVDATISGPCPAPPKSKRAQRFVSPKITADLGKPIRIRPQSAVYRARIGGAAGYVAKAGDAAPREARVLLRLRHPRLATVLAEGALDDGTSAFLCADAGRDLTEAFPEGQAVSESATLQILIDIADGLSFVHARGLCHGDVAPTNVLADDRGRGTLIDFEYAHRPGAASPAPYAGTFDFMSPEARDGAPRDARSDVFGLGAVGWLLVAGETPPPFGGSLSCSEPLRKALERFLAPLPADRPRDGREAAWELRAARNG